MAEKLGIMVCGHGSRNQNAAKEFAVIAEALRARNPDMPVEYGYLEFCNPVISEGLDRLRAKGVARVLAVPGMLFAAGHAKNDIPSVLNTYAAMHKVEITYGRELGVDLKMLRAAGDRLVGLQRDEDGAQHDEQGGDDEAADQQEHRPIEQGLVQQSASLPPGLSSRPATAACC